MGSSTFGIIHRGGLLLLPLDVISVILAVAVAFASSASASALPSPQALFPADDHQIIHHGKPKDVRISCNFNGYNGFFVKRWQCDDRAREGTCLCAAVAITDPFHSPFLRANSNGHHLSPDDLLSSSSSSKNSQDYEECCMQTPCIKHDIYNPAGRYSCMDTTGILYPYLCYSGKGIFVPNLCPNLPETIQCCTALPPPPPPPAEPRRDPILGPLTYNNNLEEDSEANNDYSYHTEFNSLPPPIDDDYYYEEANWWQ